MKWLHGFMGMAIAFLCVILGCNDITGLFNFSCVLRDQHYAADTVALGIICMDDDVDISHILEYDINKYLLIL